MNRTMNKQSMECMDCENFPCSFVAEVFPHYIELIEQQLRWCHMELVDCLEQSKDLLWIDKDGYTKDPNIVITIEDCEDMNLYVKDDLEEEFHDSYFGGVEVVMDGTVVVLYDEDDVVQFGGVEYLRGPAVIQGLDQYGNECSVTREDIENALDYLDTAKTEITVDGKSYQALRLV